MNKKDATAAIDRVFSPIVGQEKAKNRLKQILLGALHDNGFLPPVLLFAPPGVGKSKFLNCFAALVKTILNRQSIVFDSGEECGNRARFVEDILFSHVHDKDAVVFIDEVHEAKKPVITLLRLLLEPSVSRQPRTIEPVPDIEITWDCYRNSLIVATNQIDKLDPAFESRFERIDLEYYSDKELEAIILMALEDSNIKIEGDALNEIAMCNRGTARNVIHWQNAIRSYAKINGKKTIKESDALEIIRSRDCLPMGLTTNELRTLLLLERHGPLQLKQLAAQNLIDSKEQSANERYIYQKGFVGLDVRRFITPSGRKYLEKLRKGGYIKS